MASGIKENTEERLRLRVNLGEIAQVYPWVERLASVHSISGDMQFRINLCLEEVLSNIVMHGYKGNSEDPIIVHFAKPDPWRFLFIVDDAAPWFNPLEHPELPALSPHREIRIGGQGLRLIRAFADSLEYERLSNGNRI